VKEKGRERERERKEGGREGCVCGEKRDRGMRESTLHRRARVLQRAAHMRGGGATKWGFCYKNKHKAHTRGQSKKESRGNKNTTKWEEGRGEAPCAPWKGKDATRAHTPTGISPIGACVRAAKWDGWKKRGERSAKKEKKGSMGRAQGRLWLD
jgi:hypothetical protein